MPVGLPEEETNRFLDMLPLSEGGPFPSMIMLFDDDHDGPACIALTSGCGVAELDTLHVEGDWYRILTIGFTGQSYTRLAYIRKIANDDVLYYDEDGESSARTDRDEQPKLTWVPRSFLVPAC